MDKFIIFTIHDFFDQVCSDQPIEDVLWADLSFFNLFHFD